MQFGQLLATWQVSLARQTYFFARARVSERRQAAAMPRLLAGSGSPGLELQLSAPVPVRQAHFGLELPGRYPGLG